MHRLATLPGDPSNEEVELVEQPTAPVLFLTSATTDIATLAATLSEPTHKHWKGRIRALPLFSVGHPAQVDYYLSSTAQKANLIIIRLLGSRGHWSYGLEKLKLWQENERKRKLIILSGTSDNELELHSIGNIDIKTTKRLSDLLKIGGIKNMNIFLDLVDLVIEEKEYNLKNFKPANLDDPHKWDWKQDKGEKVGVIFYRALFQAGDIKLAKIINQYLRNSGLAPRTLWVSSLRAKSIQKKIEKLFIKENVKAVLTSTSFSTVEINEASLGSPLWDNLDVPVFQILTSSKTKTEWERSSIGMTPLDLSMQIVLTEIDGRITTRPCAFRNINKINEDLSTVIQTLDPHTEGVEWLVKHVKSWIELQNISPRDKKVALTIANYPVRNSRLANGVGLDTPASTVQILQWLEETGHYLGEHEFTLNSELLMKKILSHRTNDIETNDKEPLAYLSLKRYRQWWDTLTSEAKSPIINRWGYPETCIDIEDKGFPIHGISFGNICLLVQPSRGYDPEYQNDLHSPDLPPPHRYMAQYLWINNIHNSNLIVHIGKHGSVEWLPGKSVGLSNNCYPHIAINHLPNIYPFIVNDPGEGSQAKRRTQAVIIDHLTPPLGFSGLHGDLLLIESLMDEYYESKSMNNNRTEIIENKIIKLINKNHLLTFSNKQRNSSATEINKLLLDIDSYLCEIKESQIRTGLHTLGVEPSTKEIIELILLIAKCPTKRLMGITQWLATELKLELNPWSDNEDDTLSTHDINIINKLTKSKPKIKGHIMNWLDMQAYLIIEYLINEQNSLSFNKDSYLKIVNPLRLTLSNRNIPIYQYISSDLFNRIKTCSLCERDSFIKAIFGKRVISGPSGAPTRGRPEVLPTGRNFYSVDLRAMPTESAWELGRRSANNILELHIQETGEHLIKLAMSVWGTATMRNGGEDVCQLLALIGVQPIWDGSSRRVIDLEVIPLNILDRPRVDVFLRISGLFRDSFPHLIDIVNRAQQMISNLNEPSHLNPLALTKKKGSQVGRVYGSAPGSYGVGLQTLIDNSSWENRSDLAETYISWSQWRYDNSNTIIKDREGLENSIKDVQVVMHSQDNREHDILDSDDYYQFQGGLASAIEKTSGKMPELFFGDNSRIERPRVHKLSKEIDKVMRSRVLNPRWIEGMKTHGYKGAFEMAASLDYLFAYDASTDIVPNWCYSNIVDTWLNDKSTRDFIQENNPWALRDISERLLEAINRNLWKNPTQEQIKLLKATVHDSEADIEKEKYINLHHE